MWPHWRETLNFFLHHLISIHIQFTMEVKVGGKQPFLDLIVSRKSEGTLGYGKYRKPTHTDTGRSLHAESDNHRNKGVFTN